jgi:PmbA protein
MKMDVRDDIIDACIEAIRLIDASLYQGEAFALYSSSTNVELENGKLKSSESGTESGIGVRIFKGGSAGYAHSSLSEVKSAVDRAISAARAGAPDPDFKSLPLPENYPDVKDTYDRAIASLDVSSVAELAIGGAEAACIDKRIDTVNSGSSISVWEAAIMNTLGVSGTDVGTSAVLNVDIIAHEGEEPGNGFEYATSRRLDIDPYKVGTAAGEMAIKNLKPLSIESGKMDVVLDPLAVGPIIASPISVSADDAQKDRSFLTGKINEEIAIDILNVVDDGTLQGGFSAARFDGEGTPSQKTVLMENGVFKSYLYDSYTANKEGVSSTGNAERSDFRYPPSISTTNIIVSPGSESDVVEDIKKGIYVKATGDRPNMSTGDFSGMVYAGYYIEGGELKHALKQTNIGINVLDLLKQIDGVSKDVKTYFGVTTPTIRVRDVSVAGGR